MQEVRALYDKPALAQGQTDTLEVVDRCNCLYAADAAQCFGLVPQLAKMLPDQASRMTFAV